MFDAGMQIRLVVRSKESAEFLVGLRHVAQRVEFPVDGVEAVGGLGVFSEPAGPIILELTQLLDPFARLVDSVVEPDSLGHDVVVVGLLGLDLPVGPLLGFMAPVAAFQPAVGGLGEAFGFPAAAAGGVEGMAASPSGVPA